MSDDEQPSADDGHETPLSSNGPAGRTEVIESTQAPWADPSLEPRTAAQSTLAEGDVLFGEYVIAGILGKGGMGEVYRAHHRRLKEPRAIKVMRPALAADETVIELFYREAKALLSIRHPAVVHCHDLLSDEDGVMYLVMELIEGVSLAKRLAEGPMGASDLSALAARLAAGLGAVHDKGVVHRDLCPDNVILPSGLVGAGLAGEAKIIDFGIAKVLAAGSGTVIEGFKGKLGYASPEQLGFHGGLVDARSDYYSLGLVLCAAATGEPLAMGRNVVEAVDARRSLRGPPEEVPAVLRSNIAALLELDPENRRSPVDLFANTPVAAPADPVLVAATSAEPTRRAGAVPWFLATGTLGLAALIGVVSIVPSSPDEPPAAVSPAQGESARTPEPAPVVERETHSRAESLRQTLKITGLLRGAEAALDEGRLLRPERASAVARYRAVLAIDPKNREARAGIETVLERVVARAEASHTAGRVAEARRDLDGAAALAPGDARVAKLRRTLASPR